MKENNEVIVSEETTKKKVFQIFKKIQKKVPGLHNIRVTASQISFLIKHQDNQLYVEDVEQLKRISPIDYINFYEGDYVITVVDPDERDIYKDNEDMLFLRYIMHQISEVICSCVGNEFVITENLITCFIDSSEFSNEQFTGLDNIFGDLGLMYFVGRPNIVYYNYDGDVRER
jgi:hypothetical protein